MSVDTMPRLGGFDGSGNERDWREWSEEVGEADRTDVEGAGARDRFIYAGKQALAGVNGAPWHVPVTAPNFRTDYMSLGPARSPTTLARMALPLIIDQRN